MPEVSFAGLFVVCALALAAPLLLGLAPKLRLPAVVLEIVGGIAIGPSGFGWVDIDLPLQILSVVGLAFLLFLSGLEIDIERFRGRFLTISLKGLAASFAIALVASIGLEAVGLIDAPLFVAIVLLATSLGLVVPVLRDADESASSFGQLAIAGAALADIGAIILLSLFFSREATDPTAQIVLLVGFILVTVAVGASVAQAGHWLRLSKLFVRLQDTTAQIRVRGAMALMIALVALAEQLGLEVILGAFLAGALLKLIDRDVMMIHPHFHRKLDAIGFGFLIPIFFIVSGMRFDLGALFESTTTLVRVPVFLGVLLVVRGLPALAYRPLIGRRRALAAAFLQATSLPFIVAAVQIGIELGVIGAATGAGLVATGLASVLVFPMVALTILRGMAEEHTVVDITERTAEADA